MHGISGPEDFAKKEIAAVQALVGAGRTVKDACRVAGVPRCAYYRARRPSAKAESDASGMLAALPPKALKDALIHNDQGSVYWSDGWVKLCEKLQVVRSMSRRGNCWDNALSEHFFSAMKVELGLTKRGYKTLLPAKEVKELVNDYIPWYNTGRIQKKLGYLPPVPFREAFLDKSPAVMNIVQSRNRRDK